MTNLGWIRDCWSLVVSNLSPVVMSKDLFEVFRKAGPVFDAFLPKDKFSGRSRGFGFVRFKTEWDANKAIHNLNRRLIGGRQIGVQKAKYLDKSKKIFRRSSSPTVKGKVNFNITLSNEGRIGGFLFQYGGKGKS